jgi:hypothetical protein|tara:strand:+ start:301 stop:441 length:141 start_codon:yes stop_codon:yes gene_type:complete
LIIKATSVIDANIENSNELENKIDAIIVDVTDILVELKGIKEKVMN